MRLCVFHPGQWSFSALLGAIACTTAAGAAAAAASGAEGTWKAGVARVVITPGEPLWMAGYGARTRPADGKLQELYAKALALEDPAGKRLILITTDLVGMRGKLTDSVAAELQKRHGLGREQVMFTSSHTHSGPLLAAWGDFSSRPTASQGDLQSRSTIEAMDESVYYPLTRELAERSRRYTAGLHAKLIDLVGAALADLRPARLSRGIGAAAFAVNRREPTPRGVINGSNPKGPVDRDVPVLRINSRDGKLRAVAFGYACHNTTLADYQWCGDYAGYAQEYLEANHPGAVAMFFMGCGADANPLPRRTVDLCKGYGRQLADAVEAVLKGESDPIAGTARAAFGRVDLSLDHLPSRAGLEEDLRSKTPSTQRRATILLRVLDQDGKFATTYPYPIQVWRLGNLQWIALAGEAVVDYSIRLKWELGRATWVTAYANDVMAYIPSLRVLKEGGYEATIMSGELAGTAWAPSVEELVIGKTRELAVQTGAVAMRSPRVGTSSPQSSGGDITIILRPQSPIPNPQSLIPSRPNIVFFLIDDLGWADVGCFGSKYYETPSIDRLASQGMRFTDAYAACSVCSPTRASIMTGKYPARLHLTDWIPGEGNSPSHLLRVPEWRQYLPLEEVTIARALKSAGYTTASIGKWHLGGPAYYPEHHGFDLNVAGTNWGHPASYFWPYEGKTNTVAGLRPGGHEGEYLTDRLTDEAEKFIDANKDRPFFLYFPHYAVHVPLQAKPAVLAKYKAKTPQNGQNNPTYAAMIESVDDSVGRILRKLESLGLDQRTVIVFMSDNGGLWPAATSNAPLRAGKGYSYEGGIREPLIVRWSGKTKPGSTCSVPVSSIDFFPTLLAIAGVKQPVEVDGLNLVPLLTQGGMATSSWPCSSHAHEDVGMPPVLRRDALYWHYPHYWGGNRVRPFGVVRAGDWKLIEFYEDMRAELYNLKDDLGEARDLAKDQPDKAAELRRMLHEWRKNVGAQMPTPNPNYNPAKPESKKKPKQPSAQALLLRSMED